ncbi:Sap-like sulfolipid-1-addressing protein [Streptomyces sp. KhCrAH-43]|uniref:GAP family protein n=1 Tax=Streptomyces TaxID=1883 RepID=UPI00037F7012|nr:MULTISPECIES: GAP family protein [unclassified Streptomyces]MYS34237.1 GAP family protein [Streptomyces sp. SID4920]MYX68599.1 GAP family protein [Streptomyces sp. SID8373]RAJ50848.1 Sap-like sulfolipid-1-addressing protein [Streptomyces sp. KhCrAH-43]
MGEVIGAMLTSAVGIAISPLPLIAVILMLATPKGRTNGTAFTAGWVAGLAAVVAVVVAAGSGLHTGGDKPSWAYWLKLALGVLFVLMAFKQWRDRPRAGHDAAAPKWMRAIDRFTAAKAAALAVVLVAANPKNLVLAVGGAVSIATSDTGAGGKTLAAALMVLIGSLCTLLPLGVYLLGGSRSAHVLSGWKEWMSAHNAAIMTTVLAVLGTKYIGDARTGLS